MLGQRQMIIDSYSNPKMQSQKRGPSDELLYQESFFN